MIQIGCLFHDFIFCSKTFACDGHVFVHAFADTLVYFHYGIKYPRQTTVYNINGMVLAIQLINIIFPPSLCNLLIRAIPIL